MSTRVDPDAIWKAKVRWDNTLALYERAKRLLEQAEEDLRALTEREPEMSTPKPRTEDSGDPKL